MNELYSAGKAILQSQSLEQVADIVQEGVNIDAFSASSILVAEDPEQMGMQRTALASKTPTEELKKSARPREVKEAKGVERVLQTENLEKELDNQAKAFANKHPILKRDSLKNLFNEVARLGKDATEDDVIEIVRRTYPEGHEAEAEHAFEFLVETTTGDLKGLVEKAKAKFDKNYNKEIKRSLELEKIATHVGAKVSGEVLDFYNMFTDLVARQPEPIAMYEEFKKRFPNPEDRKKIEEASYHEIGVALKTKDIEPALLGALNKTAYMLHAARNLRTPFAKTEALMESQFEQYGISKPSNLNVESMTDGFVRMVGRRMNTATQMKALVESMVPRGLGNDVRTRYNFVAAEIIILQRYRDAVHQVALPVFNDASNNPANSRDHIKFALIEALEDLEFELEDLEVSMNPRVDE